MSKPLPNHMCDRCDRHGDQADELIDHLLWYAEEHDCSYAIVELKLIQQRVGLALNHINTNRKDEK